jgi:ABC-type amino acid transport substrate-binding protein
MRKHFYYYMNKKVLFVSCASMLLLISSVSWAKIRSIRFALENSYAPFSRIHTDQELQGLDIDIAKEICSRIGAHCTFQNEHMSNMIPLLKSKKYDAWIGAVTVTEGRKKDVAFSDIYFSGVAKLMVAKSSTFNATPVEIRGKIIGVEAGTSYIPYLEAMYGSIVKIQTFPTGHAACAALQEGRVDAVIDDEMVLNYWRAHHADKKQFRLIGLPAKHLKLIRQKYAIAIAKENTELVQTVNRVLAEMRADGTCAKIADKHF